MYRTRSRREVGHALSVTTSDPPESNPLDLYLVYLTPSESRVGQRLSLATIDTRLADLPLRPVLRLLALTAHRADQAVDRPEERVALARDLLRPGKTQSKAISIVRAGGAALISSQHALALALRALLQCPDENFNPPNDLPYRLGELLLALGEHLSEGRGRDDEELLLELVRLGLFYRLNGIADWYSTAHDLFFGILPTMRDDHEYIDVQDLVLDRLGLTLDQYWGISATVGVAVMGDSKLHVFPKQIGALPPDVMERWFATQTQTVDEARLLAREDVETQSPWAFATFIRKPILEAIGPDGNYPVRPQLLALKATVTGMYHVVFDLLKESGDDHHLRWSRLFGRTVQKYGRRLLQGSLPRPETVSFPDDGRSGAREPKACDVLIDDDQSLIAIDFVHRILMLSTQTSGPTAALERDLSLAIVEKVDQIEQTVVEIIDVRAHEVDRIYPVVVMSGPLPMTPVAEGRIEELIARTPRRIVGADDRCRPVAVLELHELKMFLRTVVENTISPADLLERWLRSSLGGNNFREWLLRQTDITPGRSKPGDTWEQLVWSIFQRPEGPTDGSGF